MTQPAPARITIGVDTHAEVHVAVANDNFGRRLDATSAPTTPAGYAELLGWARGSGLHLAVFEREQARVDLWRAKLPEECLMVFGSETHGVPPELVAQADEVVAIPM